MADRLKAYPKAVRARYDRHASRIVIRLNAGLDILLPIRLTQGFQAASDDELSVIEITPTGLGLHWPKIDADIYIPKLLVGDFGSEAWMKNRAADSHRLKSA